MRLNEFLTESQQREMQMLQEGPLGSLAKAATRGVGNVIGGVAKGVGAVKGAVKGAVDRVKKDFSAGEKGAYDAITGKPNASSGTAPSSGTAAKPAASAGGGTTTPAAGTPTGSGTAAKPTAPDNKLSNPTPPAGGDAAAGAPAAKQGILGKIGQAVKDFKKGYAGDDDAGIDAQKPAAGAKGGGTTAAPPGGAAQPAASDETPAAGGGTTAEPAGDGTAPVPGEKPGADKSGAAGGTKAADPSAVEKPDSELTKAKKAVDGLPPEQRKEIIAILQADPKVKQSLAQQQTNQKNKTTQTTSKSPSGKTMADAPMSATNKAKAGNPNAAKPAAEPTAVDATVNQKQLTDKGFGNMLTGLAGGRG